MVAMDMETTGLDPSRHAIVSIGVVPFDMARIRFAERRYWVVHPPRPLLRESVAFHRITHSEAEYARTWRPCYPSCWRPWRVAWW